MDSELENTDFCRNCHHELMAEDQYCPACGQKRTTGKVAVRTLIADFIENIFSLNSKTFLTLSPLFFAPGKLTKEYFNGVHKKYISPIRLFVTFLAFHFIVFNFIFQPLNQFRADAEKSNVDYIIYLDSICNKVQPILTDTADIRRVDSICNEPIAIDQGLFKFSTGSNVSDRELLTEHFDTLCKKYQINSFVAKVMLHQAIKAMKSPDNYGQYILGGVSWVVFLMIPGFALILKLLYVRRKRYYVEHLVFGLHIHAFIFAFLSLIYILIALFGSLPGFLIGIFLLIFTAYIFISMKRVYAQAWWKTILKLFFLFFSYSFLATTLIVGMLLVGFIFF